MTKSIYIGIDPGVNTGFAVLNKGTGSLALYTLMLHEGFDLARSLKNEIKYVVIEDPNLWTHFHNSKNAKEKMQGAGSIKRDYKAWVDFLTSEGIEFKSVRPDKTRNKLAKDKNKFKQITGYNHRSTEHARVAGMLVFGL